MSKISHITIGDFDMTNCKTGLELWDFGWVDATYYPVPGASVDLVPTDFFAALLDHHL